MTNPIFGRVVRRIEDPRFLTGRGRYVETVRPKGALRAVFVRSIIAHGRLEDVDVDAASSIPGVVAVLTAADLSLPARPPADDVDGPFDRPVPASGTVRYVGEPVALVLAETLGQASDAAANVVAHVEPLDVVVGVDAALADGASLLFAEAGTNVAYEFESVWEENVLDGSDVVVRVRVEHQRLAPSPMETNGIVVEPHDEGVKVWVPSQVPFDVRSEIAEVLGLEQKAVHVVAPDVGGGFGNKAYVYPEHLMCAAAAMRLGRAVAWQETRSESFVGLNHGRAQIHDVELGAGRDGTIVGLRVDIVTDMGAYPIGAYLPVTTSSMLPGPYRIPRVAYRGRAVVTNAVPVWAYRGAGRPEAAASLERAIDVLADELGVDPIELRRRNAIRRDQFPFTSPTGEVYDTGDYDRALDEVTRLAGYTSLRLEQQDRRRRGDARQMGIGVSLYVEVTGFSRKEFSSVEIAVDGSATIRSGTSPHGQGHETAFAQIASGVLGIPIERVRVIHSDTAEVERGEGTYGSRSLQIGGTSVFRSAEQVLERARRVAAHMIEVAPEDVVVTTDGRLGVAGAPDASVSWADVASATVDGDRLPDHLRGELSSSGRPYQRGHTYPFGAHLAVVDVDVETGAVLLLRLIAVDDCGRILNPLLVEGQVHGGLAQGIAQALFEQVVYDELGTPLTSNLSTYQMPAASEFPSFERGVLETPTPLNPLGAKGIGESATVGSTPAVVNAVVDALSPFGVRHLDPPLTPERVWRAIHDARDRNA